MLFNGIYSAYLRIHEKYSLAYNKSPVVMSTGYEFKGDGQDLPFKIGSQIDRMIRVTTAKHLPAAVYYPEPNFCVLLPKEHDTLLESFIDPKITTPRGSCESVALIRKIIAGRSRTSFVFSEDNPIITAIPLRARYTKSSKDKIKFSPKFKTKGKPIMTDVISLKQIFMKVHGLINYI